MKEVQLREKSLTDREIRGKLNGFSVEDFIEALEDFWEGEQNDTNKK